MTSIPPQQIRCLVQGEEKLPAEIEADAICSAIQRASAPVLQRTGLAPARVSVLVTVKSAFGLSATATVGGKTLREHNVAISDRPLNLRAVDMLANAVAAELSAVADQ
jgi:hypothetical protein